MGQRNENITHVLDNMNYMIIRAAGSYSSSTRCYCYKTKNRPHTQYYLQQILHFFEATSALFYVTTARRKKLSRNLRANTHLCTHQLRSRKNSVTDNKRKILPAVLVGSASDSSSVWPLDRPLIPLSLLLSALRHTHKS